MYVPKAREIDGNGKKLCIKTNLFSKLRGTLLRKFFHVIKCLRICEYRYDSIKVTL